VFVGRNRLRRWSGDARAARWAASVCFALALVLGIEPFGSACARGPRVTAIERGGSGEEAYAAERAEMVRTQIRARGIENARVLDALGRVPRHLFVAEELRPAAYEDHPLPIGHEQTISQPYIVALMTDLLDLDGDEKVLEIGTGSGYQAAILGELADEVYTIEIVEPLAERARKTLEAFGHRNVHVRAGNGYLGWPEQAPFDRVMVTAAPDEVPPALIEQLKVGGLMAIPVGVGVQELRILRKTKSGMETLRTLPVRFVPMTGKPAKKP
jgi:protein-L-isoaspartate(D-aspartate) O-methyltransferase